MDHENKANTLGQEISAPKKQVEVITSKWISVADQLPPEGEAVIARSSFGDGKGESCFIFEARYKSERDIRAKLKMLKKISAMMADETTEDFEKEPEDKEYSAKNWKTHIPFWDGEATAYTLLVSAITHWAPIPILEEEKDGANI